MIAPVPVSLLSRFFYTTSVRNLTQNFNANFTNVTEVRTNEHTKTEIDFLGFPKIKIWLSQIQHDFWTCEYVFKTSKNVFNDILKSFNGNHTCSIKKSKNTNSTPIIFQNMKFNRFFFFQICFLFQRKILEVHILAISIHIICIINLCIEHALTRKMVSF